MMTENPYESPTVKTIASHPRRLMFIGITCIVLALGCVAATVIGMIVSFNRIAQSESTSSPDDLANGISLSLLPSLVGGLLGVVGIVLVIAELISRRSRSST